MKRIVQIIFMIVCFTSIVREVHAQATLTEIFVPKYIYGNATTAGNLVPYVFRVKISGLQARAVYRYNNMVVLQTDSRTSTGKGLSLIVKETGFTHYTTTILGSTAGLLEADANGEYTGWFVSEAANNAVFTPGNKVQMQINLGAPGATGTTSIVQRLYTTSLAEVISFTGATAIRSTAATFAAARNFIMLYDVENPGPGDRPISGSFIESDEFDVSTLTGVQMYAQFYISNVDKVSKAWGSLIPNNLANGIRKIVRYQFDGVEVGGNVSATGVWAQAGGGTISTVNASGGVTTPIALDGAVVSLGVAGTTPQTISFPSFSSKSYGDDLFAAGATASSGLPVVYASSNPAVAVIVNGMIQIKGVGSTDITASQAGNATYMPAVDMKQTLVVNKAKLTVTAENKTKLALRANPALSIVYTGLVYSETAGKAFNNVVPVATTTATTDSPPGDYPITLSTATTANYDVTYQNGTLSIQALPAQALRFDALPAKRYGDADFVLTATVSSGLPLFYSSSNPAVAIVRGYTIHLTGVGTADITVSQPGDYNFSAATPVKQTLTVGKGKLTIKADDQLRNVGEQNPPFTLTYSGLASDEDASVLSTPPVVTTSASAAAAPGVYPITVSGAAAGNYDITYVEGKLTVYSGIVEKKDELTTYCDAPGQLKVSVYLLADEKISIRLLDGAGRVAGGLQANAVKGYNLYHIDISKLPSGVYPVCVNGGRVFLKAKAVIIR